MLADSIHSSLSAQVCNITLVSDCIKALWKCFDAECHQLSCWCCTWHQQIPLITYCLKMFFSSFFDMFWVIIGYHVLTWISEVPWCHFLVFSNSYMYCSPVCDNAGSSLQILFWRQGRHLIKIKSVCWYRTLFKRKSVALLYTVPVIHQKFVLTL